MKGRPRRWLTWTRDPEHRRRLLLLRGAPVFAGLPRRFLSRLAVRFFEKSYAAGDVVFHEGEPGKALFVVLEGAVRISRLGGEGERILRSMGPGACFGEMALIDDFPRSATARVTAPSSLLILYKSDFDALVEGHPRIALVTLRNLLHILAMYVRAATPSSSPPAVVQPAAAGAGAPGGRAPL
jgi:CRP/FNR family cyclic AMP-dependent transcriptional regulator